MALKECNECEREISTDAKSCPHCGKRNPTKDQTGPSKSAVAVLIMATLFAVGAMSLSMHKASNSGVPAVSPVASPAQERDGSKEFALEQMKLKFSWRKGGFETAMIVDFVITNGGSLPVKDLVITCEHSGSSGTTIDRNVRTIYETIAPFSTKRLNAFNMGMIHSQAVSSICRVTDLRLDE